MVLYRRNFLPGGTYFFTVTLVDRRSKVLVENVGALRNAFRTTRMERPGLAKNEEGGSLARPALEIRFVA